MYNDAIKLILIFNPILEFRISQDGYLSKLYEEATNRCQSAGCC